MGHDQFSFYIPQDNHHSGDGSRADRKPPRRANTYTRKRDKEETIRREGDRGSTKIAEGNKRQEKISTEDTQEEEVTEIHIEEDVYKEVNTWARNEIEKEDPVKKQKKESRKQPMIRDWLVKEEKKDRDGSREKTKGERGVSKQSVQSDTRAVIIGQEGDRKRKEEKGDSRTVIVKKHDDRRQAEQNEDERIVLDQNEGWPVKDRKEIDVRNGLGAEFL